MTSDMWTRRSRRQKIDRTRNSFDEDEGDNCIQNNEDDDFFYIQKEE